MSRQIFWKLALQINFVFLEQVFIFLPQNFNADTKCSPEEGIIFVQSLTNRIGI